MRELRGRVVVVTGAASGIGEALARGLWAKGAKLALVDVDAEWLLRTNLFGVLYGTKFFLPYLLERPEGHIVNLSSMFGIFSMPGQAVYSTSKAGVRAFTEALWTELAGTKVRLTCVHPGGIRTNVIRSARMLDPAARARAVALQERFAMPADRAAARIIRAIERNRFRVLVGIDAHFGVLLKRLFPVGFQRLFNLVYRVTGTRRG
jgi:short-subunit dehydrogenase